MGIQWLEGFEEFGASAGATPLGLNEKYNSFSFDAASNFTVQTGRVGGLCLRIATSKKIRSPVIAGGTAEQTMGIGYRRSSGSVGTLRPFAWHFNKNTSTPLWDITVASATGNITFDIALVTKATASAILPGDSTWRYIYFHWFCDATSGYFRMYVNGTLVINFNGDTTGISPEGPASTIKQFQLEGVSGVNQDFDDIYLCTGDVRQDSVIDTLFPKADGANSAFTPDSGGVHYSRVNEHGFDGDTSYVASSGSGQLDTYDFDDLGTTSINGLQVFCFAKSTSGSANVRGVVRQSGTDYPAAGNTSIPANYGTSGGFGSDDAMLNLVADVDPATGVAWDTTGVNSAEFGIKAI